MKKILTAVVILLCLVALFALEYKAMQTPGTTERMLSDIRDTPARIFYPIVIGFMVLALGPALFLLFGYKRMARRAEKVSVYNACKIALSLWRVSGPTLIKDDCAVMRFTHLSWPNQYFILPVRPGHPDIERFRKLNDRDIVEFEPLQKGMECALEHELCGFLRIKSVSS